QAQLIEDLLDLARIITGKLRLNLQPTRLVPVISGAIDARKPDIQTKSLTVKTELDPEAVVMGDANRLQQVMWNLLSNTVKFTPANGEIVIRAECRGAIVEISVNDSGKGISADFLPSVFSRFSQADSSSTRTHGGL